VLTIESATAAVNHQRQARSGGKGRTFDAIIATRNKSIGTRRLYGKNESSVQALYLDELERRKL
jgi:hypothetical protein